MVKILLKLNRNLYLKDNNGNTVRHLAVSGGKMEMICLFLNHTKSQNPVAMEDAVAMKDAVVKLINFSNINKKLQCTLPQKMAISIL